LQTEKGWIVENLLSSFQQNNRNGVVFSNGTVLSVSDKYDSVNKCTREINNNNNNYNNSNVTCIAHIRQSHKCTAMCQRQTGMF